MDFVANWRPILTKQNCRFEGPAVPKVLVRSVRKSDEPIGRNCTLFEGDSILHIGFFHKKPNILCIESCGITCGDAFARITRALRDSGQISAFSGSLL